MINTVFILLFSVLLCRAILTSYKSGESAEYYITVKNKAVSKIFIDGMMPMERTKSRKKDRNKLSVYGLIGYFLNLIVLILLIVFAIIPSIPCMPYNIPLKNDVAIVKTLNELVPFVASVLVCFIEISFVCLRLIKYIIKQQWSKKLKYFCLIVLSLMILLSLSCAVCIFV